MSAIPRLISFTCNRHLFKRVIALVHMNIKLHKSKTIFLLVHVRLSRYLRTYARKCKLIKRCTTYPPGFNKEQLLAFSIKEHSAKSIFFLVVTLYAVMMKCYDMNFEVSTYVLLKLRFFTLRCFGGV